MHTPPEVVQEVQKRVAENPSVMTKKLAEELGITEADVIASLPEDMRAKAKTENFEAIWNAMTGWEKTTFILANAGGIVEIAGALPKGKFMHGMFNLMDKSCPLGGHLFVEELGSIWFVSKPFFNKESHSIQFFDKNGNQMFAVYLGRNAEREIIPSVKEGYNALRTQYGKSDTCGGKNGRCCGRHHPKGDS